MDANNFWNFNQTEFKSEKYPIEFLQNISKEFNDKMFPNLYSMVLESTNSDSERITYSFVIIAPRLKNLNYKLMHIEQISASGYPCNLIQFTLDFKNNIHKENISTAVEFSTILNKLFYSPLTQLVIQHLLKLIEIQEHYKIDEEDLKRRFESKK